ncbi:CPBP family intramembrane glutamic endopeptidase [Lederbergia panacisoli]|uniref:CPBP family intramembrane glutamic endopeptidase n=1 Tax=Lederbergia panacisoli TaxID=1255251 RepID=UPI00214B6964|nr:CPBP family intramembrane glutamic endopeptidase [Lederbergia panacisoli]MCR2822700.1 CPBP family intramembrane metalloprotease [Lederbergia panacisoli]
MKKFITGLLSFIVLDLYFNITTHFINFNIFIQLISILLFFPLASFIAKVNGLQGLRGIGMVREKWTKYFPASFLIGFGCWALMYFTYVMAGKFSITGVKSGLETLWVIGQIMVGFFLGSLINDLVTRGFVINILKGKIPPLAIAAISILIYALDDFWNGDLSIINFIFSIVLGLSFTYAFFKTGSIWASTGIHFGLNMAYGMLFGLSGRYGDGIFQMAKGSIDPFLNTTILLMAAALMFVIAFLYYRDKKRVIVI